MDFNKDFEKYLAAAYQRHAQNAAALGQEPEELAADLYAEWADMPHPDLSGISPRAYFSAIGAPETLVRLFCDAHVKKQAPCPLLLDRMGETAEGCGKLFTAVISGKDLTELGIRNEELVIMDVKGGASTKQSTPSDTPHSSLLIPNSALLVAMVSFLFSHDLPPPVPDYVRILADPATDAKLCDALIEALLPFAAEAAPLLWEAAEHADERQRAYFAEILLCAPKDERTYKLLADLFESCRDIPLYAGYLGKYGDERAAEVLYKKLETCNYPDYIEVRNAIERLGGYVPDTRDFTDDEDFLQLKLKNEN